MDKIQYKMSSPIGNLFLIASEKGLCAVDWKKQNVPYCKSLNQPGKAVKILAIAVSQLEEYFKGVRKNFDLPFDVAGTPFQKSVWTELSKIPYGKTYSYKDVAKKIKNQKAMRAVGSANGKNPLAIIVPCHRVIAADGTLGGYAGGLKIKTHLLKHEGFDI